MSIDAQPLSSEMSTGQFEASQQLGQAINNILAIDQQNKEYQQAEDAAFKAIHDFCNARGIRADFEGRKTRLSFALAIDNYIRQGNSPENYDYDLILQQSTGDINGDLPVLSTSHLGRFWAAGKQASPEPHHLFSPQPNEPAKVPMAQPKDVSVPQGSEITAEAKVSPKRRERLAAWLGKRVTKKVVGAVVLTTALTVGAVFGAGKFRGSDSDEGSPVASSVPEATVTIDQAPTITMPNSDTIQDDVDYVISGNSITSNTVDEGALTPSLVAPEAVQPPQDTIITFAQGDNLWNHLQVISVGTSGIEADSNDELNQAIVFALPFIAEANDMTVQDLNHVNIGQGIVVPEGIVSHLRTIGAS